MTGRLDKRVAFHRLDAVADVYGNVSAGFSATAFVSRWCAMTPESGRERVEAGRLQSANTARIRLRDDSVSRTVTTADKAVIDGADWQIRYIEPRDRSGFLWMTIERGVAT